MSSIPPPPGQEPPPPGGQRPGFQQPPQRPAFHDYESPAQPVPPRQPAPPPGPTYSSPPPQQPVYQGPPVSGGEKRPRRKWWMYAIGALLVLGAGGALLEATGNTVTEPSIEAAEPDDTSESEDAEETESDTTEPTEVETTTTTARTTTTSANPDRQAAQVTCEIFTEFLDENPDARVIQAIDLASGIRDELTNLGRDLSAVGHLVAKTCHNGYDNVLLMAYGGFGPLAEAVDYTLDRGRCAPQGDLGGVLTLSGYIGSFTVELGLTYVAGGIVEHQTTEYLDVEGDGNPVAFEFYIPYDIPTGGECEVSLVAVQTE